MSQLFDDAMTLHRQRAACSGRLGSASRRFVLMIGAALLWWWVPQRQMRAITVEDQKARADIEDNFRKTVGQALGTVAQVLAAL